jgi:alkaline phosphatase D
MKRLVLQIFIFCFIQFTFAQPGDDAIRALAEEELKPFYHGVASGDPTPNSVIIWTRVTPEVDGPVVVAWKVSMDTTFADTIQYGTFITDATRDYTVKVDVEGLNAGTFYYYEFTALGANSIIGRTKTAPDGNVDQLRFAVVSCSNYPSGYFTAYERINERNDIDAVLHLGDYIYEYGSNAILSGPRENTPNFEIVELADYRLRHATHKLDEDSRNMHQNHPLICVWDDHESANNSYRDGSDNHTPNEGNWSDRKSASLQAYYEWMPIRLPDENDNERIFRKISYGNLADIFMIDTRLYDRDLQGGNLNDPDKKLLGPLQMQWLQNEMNNSTAKWKIIGQQVVMAPLVIPNYSTGEILLTINNDQWDGYNAERQRLYDFVLDNGIDNMVVLTGDIHTSWANDLPYDIFNYNATTGEGSVGVEFVTTAVTSTSSPIPLPPVYDLIRDVLPYIKYVDLSRKGYTLLDLNQERAQADFYTVATILSPNSNEFYQQSWYAEDGLPHLQRADTASVDTRPMEPLAPLLPRVIEDEDSTTTSIQNNYFDVLGVYPNPFYNDIIIELHLFDAKPVQISMIDTKGSIVYKQNRDHLIRGRNLLSLTNLNLPSGIYKIVVQVGNDVIEKSAVRME